MKLLFVCTAGEYRSRTAKDLFSKEYDTRNAGIRALDENNQLSKDDLDWADTVFCMEEKHRRHIKEFFPKQYMKNKIIVLSIPDIYRYNQPELVKLLEERVKEWMKKIE